MKELNELDEPSGLYELNQRAELHEWLEVKQLQKLAHWCKTNIGK